ncbi:MAG TPA: AAA family ATPase [Polyangiaceae bacterium]
MRFRRLGLDAYGPFSGHALDFSRLRGNGLHLIYGPNEAGKSSALRGIRDLLFGIPQVTPDAHLHPGPALRLSGVLERDGEQLAFVRRKKRKDSLATPDDKPLEEARLARFLNGLDAASFDRLFGLDHERLQRGGDEMLSGQGDVGEALFDAGASGRSVHRVKLQLVEEAEALFKDRAQKPELNRLLTLYADQKRRAKDAQHPPEKYEEQQESVSKTRRELESCRAELSGLRAEKEHVLRLRNVLSSVVARDRLSAERSALGVVPSLRRDTGERREQLGAGLAEAERDAARLERQLAEHAGRLERLPAPSRLLELLPDTVRALSTRIGRAEKDILDLPKRQTEARALQGAIERELPRLGLGQDLQSVTARSLPVGEQARLQELGRRHQGIQVQVESAERELPEARAKVDAIAGALEQARAARRIERDALLPAELLDRYDAELGRSEEAVEQLEQRLRQDERDRAELLQQLEQLKGQRGVPSEALVAQARSDRDARLREAQELAADPKRKALELCLPLAALAQAQTHADVLADRLRSEAQRVADAELIEQQLAKLEREHQRREEGLLAARGVLQEVSGRWQRIAGSLSRVELMPREAARLLDEEREGWREVARAEQELARARAAQTAAEARAERARRALEDWQREWDDASAPLGLGAGARPEQVLALLSALSELALQRQKLEDLQSRVSGIQRDIDQFAALVAEQTEAFAPELSSLSPPEAALRLVDLHRKASDVAAERAGIEAELGRVQAELGEARARAAADRVALTSLCQEAGVADAGALLELEQRVERARALDAELGRLDAHLAEVCEGEQVGALVAEARQSDKAVVAARLAELDDLIEQREDGRKELEELLTRLNMGLEAYVGREGADAAQELSATVARLAELASTWTRRRLAAVVLERVVEAYRGRHHGPVLTRASELFGRLTLGRFARLQVGLEEARLECVEAGSGKGLELEELSRGTRFQLYLALKLASLEQYLLTAPPLPLVLDDVLVEWDDARARVALQVLAELSERTQVLLFTHLARDVAAAEELQDGRIFTHHLAPRALGADSELAGAVRLI